MWAGSGDLHLILPWEKVGSRDVLGGQAGLDPRLLTSGKDTFSSVMLLPLAVDRDAQRDRQPGPGCQPSEHVALGAVLMPQ